MMADVTGRITTEELIKSLRYEKDTGAFTALLAPERTTAKQQLEALANVATDSKLDSDFHLVKENFPAKVTALHDSLLKSSASAAEDLLIPAAATGHPELFGFLLSRVQDPSSAESQGRREKMFNAAAGAGRKSPGEKLTEDRFAGSNITILLKTHKPTDEQMFKALESSVENGSTQQVKALAEYAGKHNAAILDKPGKHKKTLFEQVLESRLTSHRERTFLVKKEPENVMSVESADLMVQALLSAGAKPPESIEGKDTLIFMLEERFGHATVRDTARAMGRPVPELAHLERQRIPPEEVPEHQVEVITKTRER
jgi:hypothetical protein